MKKVKVVYNFQAQDGSSELTIEPGEILTVVNTEIGEGWWEGINRDGVRGLFPATYVVDHNEEPPATENKSSLPAPPPPPVTGQSTLEHHQHQQQQHSPGFFTPSQQSQFKFSESTEPTTTHTEEPDWPDEDWDDEDDSGDNASDYPTNQRGYGANAPYYGSTAPIPAANQPIPPSAYHLQQQQQSQSTDPSTALANLSIADAGRTGSQAQVGGASKTSTRRNLNRFSNFVKSGLESYIFEAKAMKVPLENVVHIQYDQDLGIIWKQNLNSYTCAVTKHGKETKMKGLKTYISYDITPSTNNIVVRRRYKHFDWLMQRLEEKFIVTPLPPLPEKQIAGRFQEDFVEHRRNLLQLWVNYITRHPVLSQCDVWWHFMTCSTDDMKGWKLGKRKAEKDELVGANFFFSVDVNPAQVPLDQVKTTKQLDNFQRFVSRLDEAVKHMFATAVDQSKKVSTVYAKDYKKLADSIKELASAFQSGTAWRNSLGLNEAIRQTSSAYEDISRLHEEEPKYDFEPMADILHQYRGLLSGWPEIIQLHKSTVSRRNEQERLLEEGKISEQEMVRTSQRSNVITYATLAEINHFHNERLVDFKQMIQVFLTAQINFHTDIVGKLQTALNKINDI